MHFTGKPNQQKEISASGIKAEKIAYGYLLLKGLTPVSYTHLTLPTSDLV